MCEHANAIAEFEHEVRPRHDVSVAAANLRDDRRFVARDVEIAERSTHHARAGHEHAQVIEIAPILDQVAGCGLAQGLARLAEGILGGTDDEHDVVFGDDDGG